VEKKKRATDWWGEKKSIIKEGIRWGGK